jgi:hypothetical protein
VIFRSPLLQNGVIWLTYRPAIRAYALAMDIAAPALSLSLIARMIQTVDDALSRYPGLASSPNPPTPTIHVVQTSGKKKTQCIFRHLEGMILVTSFESRLNVAPPLVFEKHLWQGVLRPLLDEEDPSDAVFSLHDPDQCIGAQRRPPQRVTSLLACSRLSA